MTNRQIQNRLNKVRLGEMSVEQLLKQIPKEKLIEQALVFVACDGHFHDWTTESHVAEQIVLAMELPTDGLTNFEKGRLKKV